MGKFNLTLRYIVNKSFKVMVNKPFRAAVTLPIFDLGYKLGSAILDLHNSEVLPPKFAFYALIRFQDRGSNGNVWVSRVWKGA